MTNTAPIIFDQFIDGDCLTVYETYSSSVATVDSIAPDITYGQSSSTIQDPALRALSATCPVLLSFAHMFMNDDFAMNRFTVIKRFRIPVNFNHKWFSDN